MDPKKLFDDLLKTPEGRAKLVAAIQPVARHRLEFVIGKRRRWAEGYSVSDVLRDMGRIAKALDGTESMDRISFHSLHGDLLALQDEITAFRKSL